MCLAAQKLCTTAERRFGRWCGLRCGRFPGRTTAPTAGPPSPTIKPAPPRFSLCTLFHREVVQIKSALQSYNTSRHRMNLYSQTLRRHALAGLARRVLPAACSRLLVLARHFLIATMPSLQPQCVQLRRHGTWLLQRLMYHARRKTKRRGGCGRRLYDEARARHRRSSSLRCSLRVRGPALETPHCGRLCADLPAT